MEVDVEHDLRCEWGEVDVAECVEEVGGEGEATRRSLRLVGVEVEVGSRSRSRLGVGVGLGSGVLQQQGEELGGAGEPSEGEGAELVGAGVGVAGREDLADPVHDGVHGDRVAGFESGDEGAQSVLVRAAEADVAAPALRFAPFVVQLGVGLDDLGLGDCEDAPGRLGGDHPGDGGVDDGDLVDFQVTGQLRDAAGDPRLALAASSHGPGQRQPVLQVENVGERVTRGHHPGAAGQRDLAQAEVLNPWGAVAADLDQHVADPASRLRRRRDLGSGRWSGRPPTGRAPRGRRPLRVDAPARPRTTGPGGQLASRSDRSSNMRLILPTPTDTEGLWTLGGPPIFAARQRRCQRPAASPCDLRQRESYARRAPRRDAAGRGRPR